jgi:hypothetical protein
MYKLIVKALALATGFSSILGLSSFTILAQNAQNSFAGTISYVTGDNTTFTKGRPYKPAGSSFETAFNYMEQMAFSATDELQKFREVPFDDDRSKFLIYNSQDNTCLGEDAFAFANRIVLRLTSCSYRTSLSERSASKDFNSLHFTKVPAGSGFLLKGLYRLNGEYWEGCVNVRGHSVETKLVPTLEKCDGQNLNQIFTTRGSDTNLPRVGISLQHTTSNLNLEAGNKSFRVSIENLGPTAIVNPKVFFHWNRELSGNPTYQASTGFRYDGATGLLTGTLTPGSRTEIIATLSFVSSHNLATTVAASLFPDGQFICGEPRTVKQTTPSQNRCLDRLYLRHSSFNSKPLISYVTASNQALEFSDRILSGSQWVSNPSLESKTYNANNPFMLFAEEPLANNPNRFAITTRAGDRMQNTEGLCLTPRTGWFGGKTVLNLSRCRNDNGGTNEVSWRRGFIRVNLANGSFLLQTTFTDRSNREVVACITLNGARDGRRPLPSLEPCSGGSNADQVFTGRVVSPPQQPSLAIGQEDLSNPQAHFLNQIRTYRVSVENTGRQTINSFKLRFDLAGGNLGEFKLNRISDGFTYNQAGSTVSGSLQPSQVVQLEYSTRVLKVVESSTFIPLTLVNRAFVIPEGNLICTVPVKIKTTINDTNFCDDRNMSNTKERIDTSFFVDKAPTLNGDNKNRFASFVHYFDMEGANRDEYLRQYPGNTDVWIISHGMDDKADSFRGMAEAVNNSYKRDNRKVIILNLNWSNLSVSVTRSPNSFDENVGPLAEAAIGELIEWGINDPSRVNFIGHSMGTLVSSEIGRRLNRRFGNRPVDRMILLEPPSYFRSGFNQFDVDDAENTQDSIYNAANGFRQKVNANIMRAFTGTRNNGDENLCGNYGLARTATETYQLHMKQVNEINNIKDACPPHFGVNKSAEQFIFTRQFESEILGLNDRNAGNFSRASFYQPGENLNGYAYMSGTSSGNFRNEYFLRFQRSRVYNAFGIRGQSNEFQNFDKNSINGFRGNIIVTRIDSDDKISLEDFNNGTDAGNYRFAFEQESVVGPGTRPTRKAVIFRQECLVINGNRTCTWHKNMEITGVSAELLRSDYISFFETGRGRFFVRR